MRPCWNPAPLPLSPARDSRPVNGVQWSAPCRHKPLSPAPWPPPGVFNPNSEDPLPGQLKKQLVLRIISGQQLPKPRDSMLGDRGEVGGARRGRVGQRRHARPGATPALPAQIIDPFVEVEVIGLPVDCNKEQTRVVDDNGEAHRGRRGGGRSCDPAAAPSQEPVGEPGPQGLVLSAERPASAEAPEEGVGPSGLPARDWGER